MLKRILRKQAGQVLPMALVLLTVGAMVIVPTLILTQTNLNATQIVDRHTAELYAADAGIQDAMWYLQSDTRRQIINPTDQWPHTYNMTDDINLKDVQVTMDHAWLLGPVGGVAYRSLPETQPQPSPDPSYMYYGNDHWITMGAIDVNNHANFVVNISTDLNPTTVNVDHIGVWLPQGYSYVNNSATINGVAIGGSTYVKNPTTQETLRGGTALIWSYSGITFKTLSDIAPPPPGGGVTPAQRYPPSIALTFHYTMTPTYSDARGFFPWIRLTNQKVSWDADAGFYHVTSTGITSADESTTVEAYVPITIIRYTAGTTGSTSATRGDYITIGNSLMTECWHRYTVGHTTYTVPGPPCDYTCSQHCRGKYFSESSATVNSNAAPSDAQIQRVYLYWTAWWNTNGADTTATLKVNGTLVGETGAVTADTYYVLPTKDTSGNITGYQYACSVNVTDLVKAATAGTSPQYAVNGETFSVSNISAVPANACTSSPLWIQSTNAGWSMVIIYSTEDLNVQVHQIYMYDQLAYLWGTNGASAEFTITGFQAPTSNREAKVGYFVGEGDSSISPDYFEFKGQRSANYVYLGDHSTSDPNPYNNVYNSYSTVTGFVPSTLDGQTPGTISGVDMDVYTQTKDYVSLSDIVQGGDTWAKIKVETVGYGSGCDGIMLVYVIFSVASTAVPAGEEFNIGTMSYRIQ